MTLNPITWVRTWLKRRAQEKIDAECYRRMRGRVDDLHKWCGGEFPILDDVSTWMLRGDMYCRGLKPMPEYHITDGRSTIDVFREYLRDTYWRRVFDHKGEARYEPPRNGMLVSGTFSPTEIPVEIVPPTGGTSVKRPSPTPFQFENAPQRPKPRKPKEIR